MTSIRDLGAQVELALDRQDFGEISTALRTLASDKKDGSTEEPVAATAFTQVTLQMLASLASSDLAKAYADALVLREKVITNAPLAAKVFLLAARVARTCGDTTASEAFERRSRECSDYTALRAIEALGDALASPQLSEPEGTDALAARVDPVSVVPPSAFMIPPAFTPYAPLSRAPHEPPTRTYIVLVRKLTDPVTAAFAVFSATLADLTDGGSYGREDQHGERYADLLLEFGADALPLLFSLETRELSMRLVFKASREYDTFSVQDETLYALEVSAEERRLYFKLKVPTAWLAAEVPLHLIWSNVESCVLLAETPGT